NTLTQGDNPGGFTPSSGTITGLYTWHAAYSGDGNNNSAIDQGGAAEQVTLTAASPTDITTANPTGTVQLGITAPTLNDSAALAGGFNPTGIITFTLSYNAGTVYTALVTLGAIPIYNTLTQGDNPGGFTPSSGTITGLYTWHASYSG